MSRKWRRPPTGDGPKSQPALHWDGGKIMTNERDKQKRHKQTHTTTHKPNKTQTEHKQQNKHKPTIHTKAGRPQVATDANASVLTHLPWKTATKLLDRIIIKFAGRQGRTDGQTDRTTDRRTDRQTERCRDAASGKDKHTSLAISVAACPSLWLYIILVCYGLIIYYNNAFI